MKWENYFFQISCYYLIELVGLTDNQTSNTSGQVSKEISETLADCILEGSAVLIETLVKREAEKPFLLVIGNANIN